MSDSETGSDHRTVDEQLKEYAVTCDTHGELTFERLTVGFDGQIHCIFCCSNQEMDTRNETSIDSTITIGRR